MAAVKTLKTGLLYFAYGCNMDPDFLRGVLDMSVAPGAAARVDGWRLAFNKGGEGGEGKSVTANLVQDTQSHTFGVVYRIPHDSLVSLDAFEDVPEHYRRHTLWIEPLGRYARQAALAYIAQPRWMVKPGTPDPAYLARMLRGAELHGLPASYVAELRSLGRPA
jgi:cation transport regulator ChaC